MHFVYCIKSIVDYPQTHTQWLGVTAFSLCVLCLGFSLYFFGPNFLVYFHYCDFFLGCRKPFLRLFSPLNCFMFNFSMKCMLYFDLMQPIYCGSSMEPHFFFQLASSENPNISFIAILLEYKSHCFSIKIHCL